MYQRLGVFIAALAALLAAVSVYYQQDNKTPDWQVWCVVGFGVLAALVLAAIVLEWLAKDVLTPIGRALKSLEYQWPAKRQRVPPHQWLLEIAEADRENPAATLALREPSIDLRHIGEPSPYVVFTLRIFNGCVYPVSVQGAGGDVYWGSSPLAPQPELTEGSGFWERGNVMRVRLRQWLPEEVAKSLRSRGCNVDDGIVRDFAFDSVYLMVKARPDASRCVRYGFGHLSEFIAATNR
jgi:hypothetical protein